MRFYRYFANGEGFMLLLKQTLNCLLDKGPFLYNFFISYAELIFLERKLYWRTQEDENKRFFMILLEANHPQPFSTGKGSTKSSPVERI